MEYYYEVIQKIKDLGYSNDSRDVAQRNMLKSELKRLGYTMTGRRI